MDRPIKINGFKWVALFVSLGVGGLGAFYHLKGSVRVVESNIQALESKIEMQYYNILRELDTIKALIK